MKTHPVGRGAGEAHLVGDDDHRHAPLGEVDHDVEDLLDHLGVERRGRLVEEHHLGLHGQRAGDGDALLLAAGELGGVLLGLVADADPVEELACLASRRRPCFMPRTLIGPSVTFSRIVLWAKRLKLWKTMPTSARRAASALPSCGQRLAVEGDRALVDGLEPVDRAAQRRLAGAGRADDDDDLAALDGEVDVLEHVQLAEPLVHAVEDDERLARRGRAPASVSCGCHGRQPIAHVARSGHAAVLDRPNRDRTVTCRRPRRRSSSRRRPAAVPLSGHDCTPAAPTRSAPTGAR